MKSKILLLLTLILLNSCNTNTNLYKSIRGNALGTTYSVIVETKSNESLIEDQIDSIFNQVNLSMSTYIDNSIITRVNKSAKPVEVDTNFINVFNKGWMGNHCKTSSRTPDEPSSNFLIVFYTYFIWIRFYF